MRRRKVALNAMHTLTGGGVTYLQGILPHLAADARFEWLLLVPESVLGKLKVPDGVEVRTVPEMGFWRGHLYEQVKLPWLLRAWGVEATLCNANYAPLLAPGPMPILHTTTRASGQTKGWRMDVYWVALRMLTRLSIARARVAFTLAGHVVREYVQAAWLRDKVRIAPPAVDAPQGDAARDANLVVAVGDFYPQKDYPTMLRAFALLRAQRPGTRLVIMGRAVNPEVRDEMLRLVKELKIADAVTLTGWVPHAAMMATLAKAAVFVSTSISETVQIPLLEAMACGVPVVAGKAPHSEEFVGEAGMLVPVEKGGDVPAAYAVAMYGLLENVRIAEVLARRGREKVAGMTWEATARVILEGVSQALPRSA